MPCDSSTQLNSHVSWVSILVPNFNQVPEQHWHKWNSNTKPFIPHCNAPKNVTHSKSTFHLKAKTLQHQYVTSGCFRSSNGWTLWLWMDTSLLLRYQRNRGQARQAPQRVQHKSCCWWPERRRLAKEGPLPGLRHSHLSLFLPDCIVNRGLKGGRQKRCLVQAVLSSVEGCSEWVLLLFLLFFCGRGWRRHWGRQRDGWALGHHCFCGWRCAWMEDVLPLSLDGPQKLGLGVGWAQGGVQGDLIMNL